MRGDYEQLQKAKVEMVKKTTKLERYPSYMCLTFHGVRDGGEYPSHDILEKIRSVQILIEPFGLVCCHYLPGNSKTKRNVVKMIDNYRDDNIGKNGIYSLILNTGKNSYQGKTG